MAWYALTQEEKRRLARGLKAALVVPFIDDVEDFTLEAILHYVRALPLTDPLVRRTKQLFDVVDSDTHRGWSVKGLQKSLDAGQCEFVIQRADIIKKRVALGFPNLTLDSEPAEIGAAVVEHWRRKAEGDAEAQGVTHMRLALLLKADGRHRFTYLECDLRRFWEEDLTWEWSNGARDGLVAKHGGQMCLRWYKNQKQLFEVLRIPRAPHAYTFDLEWTRLDYDEAARRLLDAF